MNELQQNLYRYRPDLMNINRYGSARDMGKIPELRPFKNEDYPQLPGILLNPANANTPRRGRITTDPNHPRFQAMNRITTNPQLPQPFDFLQDRVMNIRGSRVNRESFQKLLDMARQGRLSALKGVDFR